MAASFIKVSIDGQELEQFSEGAMLESVEVRQELNEHWWCDIECRQTEDQRFPIEDCLGKDLKVTTIDEDGAEFTLFTGFVLEAELEYEIFGSFTARITGVTQSYKMDLTPRRAYYDRDKKISTIAQELAGKVGLEAHGFIGGDFLKDVTVDHVQWGQSDWEFVKRLADDFQSWVRPSEKGIQIFSDFQEGAKLQWRDEDGLRSFKIRGRLRQPSLNGAHYFFPRMQSKSFTEVAGEPQFFDASGPMVDAAKRESKKMPPGYLPYRYRATTLEDYEQLLKKEAARSIGSTVTGWGASRNQELTPGNTVTIEGPIDAQGTYGVTKVIHRWDLSGYRNEFWCTPWKNYTRPEIPPVQKFPGLVEARVVDNNQAENIGSVKVKYFWQEENETSFTRAMTPHAGADRGFYFLPEIGDEVVVAFREGDPERPVVLGSIWNGVDQAPREEFWGGDVGPNDIKRIVTKSGHRIQLVDKEGKETISIATPKHIKIAMIENSNENGRATMMLHCDGDIFINAGGRIHLKSAFFSREVG